MDRKTILILLLCLGFFFLLNWATNNPKWFPPVKVPVPATNAVAPQTVTGTNGAGVSPAPTPAASGPAQLTVNTNEPEQLLVLTNSDVRYTFSSRGGGVKTVELLRYPAVIRRRTDPEVDRPVTLNRPAPTPVMAILDGDAVQGDGVFHLANTAKGVRAEKTLPNGLVIVKDFEPGSNYLMSATVRLENRSEGPL